MTYPLARDLSGGQHYPSFEQMGTGPGRPLPLLKRAGDWRSNQAKRKNNNSKH